MKRIALFVFALVAVLALVACGKPSRTVTFDTQGGSPVESVKVKSGELVSKPEEDPTKDEHIFIGWFKEAEATTPFDFDSPITADVTVYAGWQLSSVVVTFNTLGGSEIEPLSVANGTAIETLPVPTKEGTETHAFEFEGWYLDEGLTEAFDPASLITQNITLFAKYAQLAKHTITLSPDGGTVDPVSIVGIEGKPIGALPVPKKTQTETIFFEFAGWFSDEAKTVEVTKDTIVEGEMTLYAKWNELARHDITLDLQGGAYEGEEPPHIIKVVDGRILAEPKAPTRAAAESHKWHFAGWFLDAAGTEPYDFESALGDGDKKNFVKAPFTLYAVWKEIWTVTFSVESEPDVLVEIKPVEVVDGRFVLEPFIDPKVVAKLATHKISHYTLDGAQFDFFETPITANITLVGVWVERVFVNVSFEVNGGTEVAPVKVEVGELVARPTVTRAHDNPEKIYVLDGWFTDAGFTSPFIFTTPVEAEMTLHAKWSEHDKTSVLVSFNTKTTAVIPTQVAGLGGVEKPADPTRDGYKFAGWFLTARGLTWQEKEAVQFPFNPEESTTLHAYWEPLNSKTHNWSKAETYVTSMTSDTVMILNPLTYHWGHEADYMDLMSTPLYSTEIDWDKAMKDGVAQFPGDFSKIGSEFSIDAFDYINILVGATRFPVDSYDDEHLTADKKYDRDNATKYLDTKWTFHLREDLKFEDGTPITAKTFEYTLKQLLDPVQNNYRANLWYKTEENKNGRPIKNAFEFYTGKAEWKDVGFEVVDDYTFKVEFFEDVSQAAAIGFGAMNLLHPAKFEASLTADRTKSTYGTPQTPFVSYGAYIMKSWDENQKIVFNKNYDYVLKGTINYKSQEIQIVDNIDQQYQLFNRGELSVIGLTKDYYSQYVERPGIKSSFNGYPQNIHINLAEPTTNLNKVVHPTIMYNKEFRQSLLFGFDTKYYASSIYAPNTPSMFPMPGNAKNYMLDPYNYANSPQHAEVLKLFGLADSSAFNPTRAKELFERAYDLWVKEGNSGVVTLVLVSANDPFTRDLVTYVKDSYEKLFGADKFKIEVKEFEAAALRQQVAAWNFDLFLGNVGFNLNTDAYFQYPAIAFYGVGIGGGSLGMSQPYDMSNRHWVESSDEEAEAVLTVPGEFADSKALVEFLSSSTNAAHDAKKLKLGDIARGLKTGTTDKYVYATTSDMGAYMHEILEIDMTGAYNYLSEMDAAELKEKGLEWHLNVLKASEGKAAGIYRGEMIDLLSNINFNGRTDIYTAAMKEPFEGAGQDLLNMLAEFERVFLEYVTMVPTSERSSSTLYADNVTIDWPEYSLIFGWGAARYRYLNTDADFQ